MLTSVRRHFKGDESEEYATSGHEFQPCDEEDCFTVGQWREQMASSLLPVLQSHGVDIYNAGHVHDYETTWPICGNGTPCQKNYTNPKV